MKFFRKSNPPIEQATAVPVVEQATAAPGEQRYATCRHRYIGWEPGVGHVCRGCYAPVTVTVK